MGTEARRRRWVILPATGFDHPVLAAAVLQPQGKPTPLPPLPGGDAGEAAQLEVLASIREDGPKLVVADDEAILRLRLELPGLKVVRESFARPAVALGVQKAPAPAAAGSAGAAAAGGSTLTVAVVDATDGRPLAGVEVWAFTDLSAGRGDAATTDSQGRVTLRLGRSPVTLARLLVHAAPGYWGLRRDGVTVADGDRLAVTRIDPATANLALAPLCRGLPADAGKGVRVGVVDTGVAKAHPAIPVLSGFNLVPEETRGNPAATDDWGPGGSPPEHGTHVAGIIAGSGSGWRGIAPGAEICAYRVFGRTSGTSSSFAVAAAIDRAVEDGCDLINLSLTFSNPAEDVRQAIGRALAQGVGVIAATGNNSRQAVRFPASFPRCVAVAAAGYTGSFPEDAADSQHVSEPRGTPDGNWFAAGFTNVGPMVDLAGPGVAIVSTVPADGFGVMSGTSMATPAITGIAAALLAQPANRATREAARDDLRSQAIEKMLYDSAKRLGLGRAFEGFGLPAAQ